MKAKITEVFSSVQGEGKFVGLSQVFVRFFECHMHCVWCDTPHSIGDTTRKFDRYSVDELYGKINELWDNCHSVSLTGGEPLLHIAFLKELLPKGKKLTLLLGQSFFISNNPAREIQEISGNHYISRLQCIQLIYEMKKSQ